MRTSIIWVVGLAGALVTGCAWAQGAGSYAPDEEGWVSLFNGEDLSGWSLTDPNGTNGWSVVDGVLTNTAPSTDLKIDRMLTDHELHVEFRVPKGGNSGVYLQGRYELQVADSEGAEPESHMCGGIYGLIAPSTNPCKPAGEWQTFDATFTAAKTGRDGNITSLPRATVVFNGVTIIDDAEIPGVTGAALDDQMGLPGPLYLQGNHSSVEYRNIRYRPLKADWASEDEFRPLFDGETLDGWEAITSGHGTGGDWTVADGAITGTQDKPGNGGLLATTEPFGDFELRAEINPEWDLDSGLFLRCQPDGRCYQITVDYRPGGQVGTLYGEGIGGWVQENPDWEKYYKADDWNEVRAIITGQPPRTQIWLNGNLVIDNVDTEERLPAEGSIAVQVHGGGDWQGRVTRFRNIRIRPIEP